MNAYEEKQEAKRQYYLDKAAQAREESKNRWDRAREMGKAIPFGQPILVGHHSEKGDRAYRNRMNGHYEKAMELNGKAEYYERKAEGVGRGGISSDDPDAVEKLQAKLDDLKNLQERMKEANKAIRMKDTTKGNEKLKEMGYSDSDIAALREGDFAGRIGYPAYALQNNSANIRRIEQRIKALEKQKERTAEGRIEEKTDLYEYREEDNRCQFIFDGKPSDEIRTVLKGNSFKWSPNRGAWVRQNTVNGRYAAERVKKQLSELKRDNGE